MLRAGKEEKEEKEEKEILNKKKERERGRERGGRRRTSNRKGIVPVILSHAIHHPPRAPVPSGEKIQRSRGTLSPIKEDKSEEERVGRATNGKRGRKKERGGVSPFNGLERAFTISVIP